MLYAFHLNVKFRKAMHHTMNNKYVVHFKCSYKIETDYI